MVFEVGESRVKGHRMIGNPALFDSDRAPAGETPENFRRIVADALGSKASNERRIPIETLPTPPPATPPAESLPVHDETAEPVEAEAGHLQREVQALRTELALLRGSTSWHITNPLRPVGRLMRGRGDR
jgi:hypothetical protein